MMKKLLCFAVVVVLAGCGDANAVPDTVDKFLKKKINDTELTWKQVGDNYQYCQEGSKKWELVQRGNSNDFVFTCNIKEAVAKEMDGYGKNWTTPVLYKVEHSYLTQKGPSETKIMESDQLSVFTTAIGETKPTKHTTLLTNANNFIENKSPKEIVKMWQGL